MPEISRVVLFGKLNSLSYKAIDSATVFCKLRGNPYVELVHWLHQLLQLQDSDLHWIVRHFELDPARLSQEMMQPSIGCRGSRPRSLTCRRTSRKRWNVAGPTQR